MTTFPGSPKLNKGALLAYRDPSAAPRLIAFQYNPETLSRTLEARTAAGGGEGSPDDVLRIAGAPTESIKLEAIIDATDQMEAGHDAVAADGIHPQLALLELLIYPESARIIANTAQLASGRLEVSPPQAPLTLFVWGKNRVLPVIVTEFAVTEEAYDPMLNPIRARVSLGLKVLSYNDVSRDHPAHALFLTHQLRKEAMAAAHRAGSVAGVTGVDVTL